MNTPRIDRLLTLRVAAPLARVLPQTTGMAIPILMYHSISDDVDDTVHPYYRTVTRAETFAQQIERLRRQRVQAMTLTQATRLLRSPAGAAGSGMKWVVLTFDDGFLDFYTTAYPILARAGFAATVFMPSGYIGKTFLTGRDCMSGTQLRELSDKGIEFGSHSVSHRRLVELPRDELAEEVTASKRSIEDITGKEVTLFSYPYRFPEEDRAFTRSLAELFDESGYEAGVTTAIGRSRSWHDMRFLPRLPVNDCDDEQLLHAKLAGHYDWLHASQVMSKKSRALLRRWMPS